VGPTPNAVRITARRAVQNSNPVDTVFAKIFGFDTIDVSATSIAARGIVDRPGPGDARQWTSWRRQGDRAGVRRYALHR
jgi:hypothetical protein